MSGPFADCPVPVLDQERILLGPGSGGRLSADLVGRLFLAGIGLDTKMTL